MNRPMADLLLYVWYFFVLEGIRYVAELYFVAVFCGKKTGWKPYAIYLAANYALFFLSYRLHILYLGELFSLLLLLLVCQGLLHIPFPRFVLPVTIVFVFTTFYSGFLTVVNHWFSTRVQLPGLLISTLLQMLVSALLRICLLAGYWLIVKKCRWLHTLGGLSVFFTLLPSALIIWAVHLLMRPLELGGAVGWEDSLGLSFLLWLVVMLLAFLAVLVANDRMARILVQSQEQKMLQRELRIQSQYTRESLQRWQATKAYQHDVRNHLLVLSGLLRTQQTGQALAYLGQLVEASEELAPRVATGSPGLDILLEEKLRFAEQEKIPVTLDLHLPLLGDVEELDGCILFANGLDNAIAASLLMPEQERFIAIQAFKRHGFTVIQIKNATARKAEQVAFGVGLGNVKKIAQKYGGSLSVQSLKGVFTMAVLLAAPGQDTKTS